MIVVDMSSELVVDNEFRVTVIVVDMSSELQ